MGLLTYLRWGMQHGTNEAGGGQSKLGVKTTSEGSLATYLTVCNFPYLEAHFLKGEKCVLYYYYYNTILPIHLTPALASSGSPHEGDSCQCFGALSDTPPDHRRRHSSMNNLISIFSFLLCFVFCFCVYCVCGGGVHLNFPGGPHLN